uniref:Uncharacterized protein n=1 Tax=Anguilla anguilla TaxID=7936 RepID=A0A0E9RLS4_ANGAN
MFEHMNVCFSVPLYFNMESNFYGSCGLLPLILHVYMKNCPTIKNR